MECWIQPPVFMTGQGPSTVADRGFVISCVTDCGETWTVDGEEGNDQCLLGGRWGRHLLIDLSPHMSESSAEALFHFPFWRAWLWFVLLTASMLPVAWLAKREGFPHCFFSLAKWNVPHVRENPAWPRPLLSPNPFEPPRWSRPKKLNF